MTQSFEVALVLLLPCAPQKCMWGEGMSERMTEVVRILIAASVENETSGCSFFLRGLQLLRATVAQASPG